MCAQSCPTLATPWTVACQAPLSMGFCRQEYWSGLPFPPPGNLQVSHKCVSLDSHTESSRIFVQLFRFSPPLSVCTNSFSPPSPGALPSKLAQQRGQHPQEVRGHAERWTQAETGRYMGWFPSCFPGSVFGDDGENRTWDQRSLKLLGLSIWTCWCMLRSNAAKLYAIHEPPSVTGLTFTPPFQTQGWAKQNSKTLYS